MKTLLKTVGAILVCLIVLLVVLSITGFGPRARTPGLWLKGNLVTTPVADWSFTDKIPTVQLQTETWYLLPHSVNINCVYYDGKLYLTSVYPGGTRRSWNENVERDPHVRIKIGDQLYDRKLTEVTDPAEKTGELQARATKYRQLKPPADMTTAHVYRVDDN
jgi:hypothetical protein